MKFIQPREGSEMIDVTTRGNDHADLQHMLSDCSSWEIMQLTEFEAHGQDLEDYLVNLDEGRGNDNVAPYDPKTGTFRGDDPDDRPLTQAEAYAVQALLDRDQEGWDDGDSDLSEMRDLEARWGARELRRMLYPRGKHTDLTITVRTPGTRQPRLLNTRTEFDIDLREQIDGLMPHEAEAEKRTGLKGDRIGAAIEIRQQAQLDHECELLDLLDPESDMVQHLHRLADQITVEREQPSEWRDVRTVTPDACKRRLSQLRERRDGQRPRYKAPEKPQDRKVGSLGRITVTRYDDNDEAHGTYTYTIGESLLDYAIADREYRDSADILNCGVKCPTGHITAQIWRRAASHDGSYELLLDAIKVTALAAPKDKRQPLRQAYGRLHVEHADVDYRHTMHTRLAWYGWLKPATPLRDRAMAWAGR